MAPHPHGPLRRFLIIRPAGLATRCPTRYLYRVMRPIHGPVRKFPRKLRGLMDARRFSSNALAAAVGVSPHTVARWLDEADAAEPRLSQARTLAGLLGVPLEYLADDRQDAPAPDDDEGGNRGHHLGATGRGGLDHER